MLHASNHTSHHNQAVVDATKAFCKVKEYKGFFKPKQHFAAHASINTLRMGPMRGCAPPLVTLGASCLASHATASHASHLTPRITCDSFS